MLEAQGLTYAYRDGGPALSDLDLVVRRGRRLAILGPNGAGKTTLLLHLNGTLRPQRGRVLLDGAPAGYGRADLNAWRRRVGLVLQDADDQLFAASVEEDVSFGPLNLGLADDEVRRRVADALLVMGIAELAARPTHMLSFGQKKRVAIAGAVAMRPEVLLLDEPTAGLDRAGLDGLLAALQALHADGATLVFATHDVDLAYRLADDVALFAGGKVLRQGLAEDVLADRAAMAAAGIEPPFLLTLGLAARDAGHLGATDPLPKTRDAALSLVARSWGKSRAGS
ncbi:cobalt ABC transporter ATP-binding protein [Rhodoplanes elegans]|uniref:ABC transporter ATP-binding protein n=1 Tax=Rhodoplanes elegans TaxID=29408 RepID=A0A327KKH8_9BRAD|nr:ATP-binding cassette domain-containing protein [Rhodoplanes elegans]MBK5959974.1 cobalt ABC transporter ATP-binding protein [Rhodoplanes elegans]RAI38721.1 cobalt ABC transporter ATP-binding protein [Rhodoplanes elegans]